MSDALARDPAHDPARHQLARRSPLPLIAVAVLLAFVAGLAAMALVSARYRTAHPAVVAAAPPPAVPVVVRPVAATMPTDPATLAGRETLLAAQLGAIEARTGTVAAAAAAASGQASRAEAMLIAFAARRAIDRGLRLGALEAPLRARFGPAQPQALAAIVGASRSPLTLEDLRAGLELLSTDLVAGNDGWWTGVRHELGSLIVIHKAGTPSPAPTDRLARIRRLVDTGQVEAALAEVGRMPGADDAGNWIAAAHRYVDVHRALDTLEAAAIQGEAVPVIVPSAAVAPAPATSPAPTPAPAGEPAQGAATSPAATR